MTLWFNDYSVDAGFSELSPDVSYPISKTPMNGARWTRVTKGTGTGRALSIVINYGKTDVATVFRNIEGICQTSDVVLIRSDTQNVWDGHTSAYMKVERVTPQREAGYTYFGTITISGEVVGIPVDDGGDAYIGTYWNASPQPLYGWDAVYYPWGLGGRNGLVPAKPVLGQENIWQTRASNNIAVVGSTAGTWSLAKESDGTTVMRKVLTNSDANPRITFAGTDNQKADGYWFTTFKTSDDVTNAGPGLLIRLDTTGTATKGYLVMMYQNTDIAVWRVDAANSYTILANTAVPPNSVYDNEWHTIGVHAIGSTITVFYDGVVYLCLDRTADGAGYTAAGYWGLYAYGYGSSTSRIAFGESGHAPHLNSPIVPLTARSTTTSVAHDRGTKTLYIPVSANLFADSDNYAINAEATPGAIPSITPYAGTVAFDNGTYRTFIRSVKVSAAVGTRNFRVTANVTPGKTYLAEAWFKLSAGHTGDIPYITSLGSEATHASINREFVGAWQRAAVLFVQPVGVTTATIRFYCGDSTDVWVDDMSLRECLPMIMGPRARLLTSMEATS